MFINKTVLIFIKMTPRKKGISFKTIQKNTTLGDFKSENIKKEDDNNEEE